MCSPSLNSRELCSSSFALHMLAFNWQLPVISMYLLLMNKNFKIDETWYLWVPWKTNVITGVHDHFWKYPLSLSWSWSYLLTCVSLTIWHCVRSLRARLHICWCYFVGFPWLNIPGFISYFTYIPELFNCWHFLSPLLPPIFQESGYVLFEINACGRQGTCKFSKIAIECQISPINHSWGLSQIWNYESEDNFRSIALRFKS